jgi:hypothetical protein
MLAHAFLWEYSYKGMKSVQLLGQLGNFLTFAIAVDNDRSGAINNMTYWECEETCQPRVIDIIN